jgi:hypothetical protein
MLTGGLLSENPKKQKNKSQNANHKSQIKLNIQ